MGCGKEQQQQQRGAATDVTLKFIQGDVLMQDTFEVAAERNAILMQFVLKSLREISTSFGFHFQVEMRRNVFLQTEHLTPSN